MKAEIKKKMEVAEETLRVEFDLMGERINFQAGQYIYITIPNPPFSDEKGNRRHFSISSAPEDKDIVITTRLRPSAFKMSLAEVPLGYEVELGPVGGEFILPYDVNKHLVFLAGGIGITPYISMLGHIKNKKLPFNVTLIYSNRDQYTTAYLEELKAWSKEIPDFKLITTMTGDPKWAGERRRIDTKFLKEYLVEPNIYTYYVSGPPDFVEGMGMVLEKTGAERANINLEHFTGY